MMHLNTRWNFNNRTFSISYRVNSDTNHLHVYTDVEEENAEVYSYKLFPDTISPVINACTPDEEVKGNHLRNFILAQVPNLGNYYSFSIQTR